MLEPGDLIAYQVVDYNARGAKLVLQFNCLVLEKPDVTNVYEKMYECKVMNLTTGVKQIVYYTPEYENLFFWFCDIEAD